ncbi:MAG: restriction endonuclease subunit S [Methanophagales archaeon]|nr:restriction endonuclease subunit S [Methanophagales archaeon]
MADRLFQLFDIKSRWVFEGEKRLDASFYATDVIASKVLMTKLVENGIQLDRIEDLSEKIFWPGRFKRRYVSKKEGDPFLMPSEVIMFLPKPKKFIIDYPKEVSIKENWILITRSGSVGRCLITSKPLKRYVLSDDLIRIVPKDETKEGYLYAYLNTWIGQAFLIKDQYGSTVKHIEPHHVANILIPRIPELEEEINQKILEAHRLREEAQELLLKAEDMLYSELGLPEISEEDVEYLGGEEGKIVKSFEIKASELNLRLDASYHLPIIRQIEKNLGEINMDGQVLGNKISIFIPPRFKRPYVKKYDDGVRYIRPSDLPLIKYFESRYLARTFKNCDLYRLREGEILVVTDGTIGWASIVTPLIAGWYGSNNFARIVPTEDLDRGYLLAYLLSPYGQYQLKREIFGGVIDHLTEDHIRQIKILLPSERMQTRIGKVVIEAYIKKDKANQIEDEAIKLLERRLKEIAEGKP